MERLTAAECAHLGSLTASVDCERVWLHRTPRRGLIGVLRRLVLGLSGGRAIALGNHVFLPDRCARDVATLAHELTHCGQYQAWGGWRYYSRGGVAQARQLLYRRLGVGRSPYAYRLEAGKPFDAYGMEQQGQIVEDSFRGDRQARGISPFRPPSDLG